MTSEQEVSLCNSVHYKRGRSDHLFFKDILSFLSKKAGLISKKLHLLIPMGDMFISFIQKADFMTEIQAVTAFLRAEPYAVSLAWWYIGSRLSAVCLCQWMRDSCGV